MRNCVKNPLNDEYSGESLNSNLLANAAWSLPAVLVITNSIRALIAAHPRS